LECINLTRAELVLDHEVHGQTKSRYDAF